MKRSAVITCLFAFAVVYVFAMMPASSYAEPLPIDVTVSPKTIVFDSESEWLTVHTDIALSAVDTTSIELNELAVSWTKADARGNLVAKFDIDDVKAMVTVGEAVLTLTGYTKAGVFFSGTDVVPVKDTDPGR